MIEIYIADDSVTNPPDSEDMLCMSLFQFLCSILPYPKLTHILYLVPSDTKKGWA